MPTITVVKSDFERLLGTPVDLARLDQELEVAKAELKGYDADTDEMKIELNDTNRPDLWSAPGVARQLRVHRQRAGGAYAFFDAEPEPEHRIVVDANLETIRPFVAGFIATGYRLDDAGLKALIQSQEKLSENYGRRRQAVAIGAYRTQLIEFPVHYRGADPDATRFVPLDFEAPLDLRAILAEHPKGREYGHLIESQSLFPLLTDARGNVLSMPPVINSNHLGHVVEGDDRLFVEVTGHDLRQLLLAINIAASDLADRGATILPVTVEYPYDTPYGRMVVTPSDFVEPASVALEQVRRLLGDPLSAADVESALASMGHRAVAISGDAGAETVTLRPPAYRDDLLHAVDVIEDVAIARNLNALEPILPQEFTIGRLSAAEETARRAREHLIGAGFQEVVSTVLTSREALYDRMRRPDDGSCIEVDNVMSGQFAILRDSVLPSLLAVEAVSQKAMFPHRTFEIGEVAIKDAEHILGCRTLLRVGALLSHPRATVSELQSTLEALTFYMLRTYEVVPIEHPAFMEGRVGAVRIDGADVGVIGELHPECLERWGLNTPVSALEIDLAPFTPDTEPA